MLSYLWSHLRPYPVEENLEQWVSNRFGKRLYQIFFKTYTEKVWGIPCTEIRAEWAAQRIQGLSLAKAILNAASLQQARRLDQDADQRVPVSAAGTRADVGDGRATKIREMGGEVLMQHDVTEHRDRRTAQSSRCARRRPTASGASRASTSSPRCRCATWCARSTRRRRQRCVAAAEGLNYRDFLTVALMLDQENLFPDNWIYIHTPGVKVGRIQNFNNWSRAMVPEPGTTCLGLEYFCFEGDGLWTSSRRGPDRAGDAGAGRARPGDPAEGRRRHRGPHAEGLSDLRLGLSRRISTSCGPSSIAIPNLHTVGRNGMHKYNNQDHSMLTAMMAVANMRGASHDIWAVNTDFEYHEEQRIEAPTTATTRAETECSRGAAAPTPRSRAASSRTGVSA